MLMAEIAAHLGLTVVGYPPGGEFGATLVRDGDGRALILRARPADLAATWSTGAEMANLLAGAAYPAPHYRGTGYACGGTWSLQERLPGAVPSSLSLPLARQLVELSKRHAGAAGRASDWFPGAIEAHHRMVGQLLLDGTTRALAERVERVFRWADDLDVRRSDVQHGDFHHRNLLATGGQITAIIDWEHAAPGDWRFDLATLGFWSALRAEQFADDARSFIRDEMTNAAPPKLLAVFTAMKAASVIEFYSRIHPELVSATVDLVQECMGPWWIRAGG